MMQGKTGSAEPVKCLKKGQGLPTRIKSRQLLETALTGPLCGFYGGCYAVYRIQQMPTAPHNIKRAAQRSNKYLRHAALLA